MLHFPDFNFSSALVFHKDVIARMTAQIEVHQDDSLNPDSFSQVKGGGRFARLILPAFPGRFAAW